MSAIGYKNHKVLANAFKVRWHPKLIELLIWLTFRTSKGKMILTSTYRSEDSGVHGTIPLRAFDLRSWVFKNPQDVADDVNKYWSYDPDRAWFNTCLCHDTGKGWHLHFQVHDKSILKDFEGGK